MTTRRVVILVLLGVVVYLATLLLAAPAARVIGWIDPESVTVHGADGPIWSGHATRVEIDGAPVALDNVAWDVSGWRLLTGELGSRIEADIAGLDTRGYIAARGENHLRFADLTVRGPVSGLLQTLPFPVAAAGSLLAHVESGAVVDGVPRAVIGRAVWSDARLQAPVAVGLGEIVATFEPDGDDQGVDVRARGGDVQIDGRITVQPDGQYDIEMALTPTARAGKQIRDTLTLLARPDEEGRYVIRQRGRLR